MQTSTEQVERAPSKRKRNFAIFLIILLLIGAGCVAWYMLYARYYEGSSCTSACPFST